MESRLGRGLGSLLPQQPNPGSASADSKAPGFGSTLPIEKITPNPFQPRKVFDPKALEELRDSIQNHGILQPVVVRQSGQGFELISGERRWRASQMAGLEQIPAIVREGVTDDQMLELALVENVQRQDLDPIEKARGYRGMMKALGLTQDGVAAKVGLRRSTVANHIRLLELPEDVREGVSQGLLSMGHARALLALSGPEEQLALMKELVRKDWSVREVEKRIRERANPVVAALEGETKPTPARPPWMVDLESRMRDHLGTKVAFSNGSSAERGQVVIDFFSRGDLDRLLTSLAPRETV